MPAGLTLAHRSALAIIAVRLAGLQRPWALTGSTAFALLGLPVTPHDIDLQTDAPGTYECERLLADYAVVPVAFRQAERVRSHLGTLRIESVDVEVIGDIEKRGKTGKWSAPPHLPPLIRWRRYGGLRLPVLRLDYEAAAYRAMGRLDRAALIDRWLAEHPEAREPWPLASPRLAEGH